MVRAAQAGTNHRHSSPAAQSSVAIARAAACIEQRDHHPRPSPRTRAAGVAWLEAALQAAGQAQSELGLYVQGAAGWATPAVFGTGGRSCYRGASGGSARVCARAPPGASGAGATRSRHAAGGWEACSLMGPTSSAIRPGSESPRGGSECATWRKRFAHDFSTRRADGLKSGKKTE